jgi:hypothetical protein
MMLRVPIGDPNDPLATRSVQVRVQRIPGTNNFQAVPFIGSPDV